MADTIAWEENVDGLFFVSSFRKGIESLWFDESTVLKDIWKGICPAKIEIFLWQALKDQVFIKDVMFRSGMDHIEDLSCFLCRVEAKTVDHLFLNCSWTRRVWEVYLSWWGLSWCFSESFMDWFRA
ncbi:hypothetical protein LWI28_015889 [Acer negundo]|uniref:Reverse transcriptase zinc-binding domain-containing protein n=1 Tax=Acer negundo TaxID=4023 RepID=A0AAD5JE93_ACENE|nr:hypothetical protein LWI28_015889 [Acer negundo]